MNKIEITNLTKAFKNNKGIFDVSFFVPSGSTVGFLGPNGAGKTTTIRHLMGFVKPDSGTVQINKKDCFLERAELQKSIGYLPSESSFPKSFNAGEMISMVKGLRKSSIDDSKELMNRFGLNPKTSIKTMSLGEKKKLGIVLAFMSDPSVLILDEPTNGLDPLLQNEFYNLLKEYHQKGATILMSSHRFEEVESLCESVVMIKEGKIVSYDSMNNIKQGKKQIFNLEFTSELGAKKFIENWTDSQNNESKVRCFVSQESINNFIKLVSNYQLLNINCEQESLSDFFMRYYEKGEN